MNVYTPSPGIVEIRSLLENGDIPSNELLEQINSVLSATNIRPFTDKVLVKKPESIEYDIIIKYWINSSDKNRTTLIQSEVEKAIDEYKQWQRSVMGRDINPDEIIQRLKKHVYRLLPRQTFFLPLAHSCILINNIFLF